MLDGCALRWCLSCVVCLAAVPVAEPAPVEDRTPRRAYRRRGQHRPRRAPVPDAPDAGGPPPGAENAGKPGYYTVKPGDTLIRIGLETGQNWRDIARWNNIDNPKSIEVGQVMRVVPPGVDPGGRRRARPSTTARVETRPLDAAAPRRCGAGRAAPAPARRRVVRVRRRRAAAAATAATAAAATRRLRAKPTTTSTGSGRPAAPVVGGFDEARNKGLAISGKAGDPVLAAADGRVVYAGSGLRGYGNLVIVKHNNTYLTAYAHNQSLLVKEDQVVRRGQKIAEMGSSDAERVQLHFEIRRQGKPIDPARLLPPR